MSRCFPFPPPGYEKKTRAEDLDLLKKEKHREKKHKREKRDRDKKEGKEKREKDRSDEKHREKNDKKEKHRDKKKDKEKSRDKDKNNHAMSDEKKFLGQAEAYKGDKNDERSRDRGKEKTAVSGEKVMGHSTVYNGMKPGKNSHLTPENKNFKLLHELGDKVAIEEGKRSSLETRKDVGIPRMSVSSPSTPLASSERSKERKVNDEKIEKRGPGVEARPSEKLLGQKFVGMAQSRVEGMGRLVEKNARMEVKEKIRGKEGDDKKVDKRKDEDREKTIHKYKEKDKEKKKGEKLKEMGGEKLLEQSGVKDSNRVHPDQFSVKDVKKKDLVTAQSARLEKIPNEGNKSAVVPENIRKRKEFGPNGVSYEDDIGAKKMARITSSSLPMTQNGRSLHSSQNSTILAPGRQQTSSNIKLDGKDRRINGTVYSDQSASRTSQATALVDQNAGAVKKLPHPDTKYLAQILSVPKIDDWSQFDDQEWLFCSSHSQLNKPKTQTSGVNDTTPQVWAEARRLESADLFALPYVIPR